MNETSPPYLTRLTGPPPVEALGAEAAATPFYTPPLAHLVEVPRAIPQEQLDPDAVRIVHRLNEHGFTAYLVGGCVRDLLFGLRPKDFDIATSATPRDMRKLFRNCRIIGRRFRLAHVFFRDKIIEVATFRAAAENASSEETDEILIRDDNVFGGPEEDAVRRDFTFNALFYDCERQLILDYVGGVADVERRAVRTIGDPGIRMREDPIRMLRAIRLAARMNCTIEPATWRAIEVHRREILRAAAPRISEDLLRMFRGGAMAPAMDLLLASGVLEVILPELHAHLARVVGERGPDEVEALRAALRVVDARTQNRRPLSAPAQLSVLLAPPLLTNAAPHDDAPVYAEALGDALRPIALRLSISRKDCERIRQLLAILTKLVPRGPRKRRSQGAVLRRACFTDALDVFEVMALATGDLVDEAVHWRRRLAEAFPHGVPSEAPPRRRRDRRRRRPRGKSPGGAASG